MNTCPDCGKPITLQYPVIDAPPLKAHPDTEPMYTDDDLHWYYEGERPSDFIRFVCQECATK